MPIVPQIVVTFPPKGLRLNLLNANHRAADAIVRCSAFEQDLLVAFQEIQRGNAEKLARIRPHLSRLRCLGFTGYASKSAAYFLLGYPSVQRPPTDPFGELSRSNDDGLGKIGIASRCRFRGRIR